MNEIDVARDDLALDALAAGTDPGADDAALSMLFALRTELDPPVHVTSERLAPVVPIRSRRRSSLLFAIAAAAGLVVGGVTAGAVAVADRPGEFLHTTHVAVLGTNDESAAEATRLLDEAAATLARGDRPGARRLLDAAARVIGTVPDGDERSALRARHATLLLYVGEAPSASPTPSPSPDDSDDRTPEPRESDDSSGSGSGSDDSRDDDSSGSGSGGSGSGDSSGSGSGGSGSSGSGRSGSSGSGSDHD